MAGRYREHALSGETADLLYAAAAAFDKPRELVRNKLSHAHPYTAGKDTEGNFLPGLGYTVSEGSSWKTLSSIPEDLLDLASEVEEAIDPLSNAREAVLELPVSKLL